MTDKLNELLATKATLEEALMAADGGPDTPEVQELRQVIADIDAALRPIREAEAALGESSMKLADAKAKAANAAWFDAQVSSDDLSRTFGALFNNQGDRNDN